MNSVSASSRFDAADPVLAPGPGRIAEVADLSAFARGWCAAQAAAMGPRARVWLLWREAAGGFKLRGAYPASATPGPAARDAAAGASERGKAALRRGGGVAWPLLEDGAVVAVALTETAADDAATLSALRALQWGAYAIEAWRLRQAAGATGAQDAAGALELLTAVIEAPGFRAAADAAATQAAIRLDADRVTVVCRRRGRGRVEAISHAAGFRRRTGPVDLIAAAAEEAFDQGDMLAWPAADDALATLRAQAALAREGGGSVATAPMGAPEAPWGALVAEFAPDAPPDAARLATLDYLADVLAPALEAQRREDRWLPAKAADSLGRVAAAALGPGRWAVKLGCAAALLAAFAAATVTAPHRVTADARIEAAGRHAMTAPFDGFLDALLVRPGDAVTRGQVVARLDRRELTLERLRHVALARQKEVGFDKAVADGDRAGQTVLRAEMAEVAAQLTLIETMLAAAELRAPFDGLVVSGRFEEDPGSPVNRGDELLSVAPLDGWRVAILAPDADMELLAPGQTGAVRLAALPDRALPLTVTRLTPVAEPHEGVNAFRVEADLRAPPLGALTPGMEGVAKVTVGERLWIVSVVEPMAEWLRLALWRWWP